MSLAPYAKEHEDPRGAGDSRPTGLQVTQDLNMIGKLTGKVFLITGATSGIGIETTRALCETGADIYITARTHEKAETAIKEIKANSKGTGKLDYVVMELDSFDSIKQGAQDFLGKTERLNVLIENAGVAGAHGRTKDGFEIQFGVNHLGHFLLFQLLKYTLLASSTPSFNSRVVVLSSGAHRITQVHFEDLQLTKVEDKDRFEAAYGQSKCANVWMANELERQYGSKGIHAWSVHPGVIKTALTRHVPHLFDQMVTKLPEMAMKVKSPEQGAATTIWAALAKELESYGGKYLEDCQISPPIDPQTSGPGSRGHAPWAYDQGSERRLWEVSEKITGTAGA